ncbi:MAG: hypothetical protein ACK4NX_01890, partial [Candidatus Paceibacteria bacterium]
MQELEHLYKEEEFQRDIFFYELYRKALETIIDFNQIDNFADVGCANGKLLESILKKYPHMKVLGIDIFEWAKKHADPLVRDYIQLVDLRKPLSDFGKWTVVNCTEVGEHIDREYEEVFFKNLDSLTKEWLILSWSDKENPQHLNPRSAKYVKDRVCSFGFEVLEQITRALRAELRANISPYGYQWWAESVTVYQRKTMPIHRKYYILGTRNTEPGSLAAYRNPFLIRSTLQQQFNDLKKTILTWSCEKKSHSIIRFGDGDLNFLMRRPHGSAAPGRRGSLLPYSKIDSVPHRFGFLQNDLIALELQPWYRRRYLWYFFYYPILFNRLFLAELRRKNFSYLSLLRKQYSL